ncbi:hypothetical protein TorRG33x02_178880 [Trema orientale]|uniref:Uncharacterized protein n=1 Tax=Trema orientale TaxID=63057 RepID=A0A2P5ELC9_TREOI|nr:hypothetical protein TorRG33x02_178880 [Trema orientale]
MGTKAITPEVASTAVAISSQSTCEWNVSAQHVFIPKHFQVPEALKNELTFGPNVESVRDGVKNLVLAESSPDSEETPEEPSSRFVNSAFNLSAIFCLPLFHS